MERGDRPAPARGKSPDRHHKSVARQHRRCAPDRPRHLEDLRKQQQARIPPLSHRRKRYVRMDPVDVWISTDSVSLIIIPFSDVVDGNEPRRRPAKQLGARKRASGHFLEVSLPRSFAIRRNCSSAASRSSTISWAMMSGSVYREWPLTPSLSSTQLSLIQRNKNDSFLCCLLYFLFQTIAKIYTALKNMNDIGTIHKNQIRSTSVELSHNLSSKSRY